MVHSCGVVRLARVSRVVHWHVLLLRVLRVWLHLLLRVLLHGWSYGMAAGATGAKAGRVDGHPVVAL